MSKPPRDLAHSSHDTYFLTFRCAGGNTILRSDRMALLFIRTIQEYRAQGKLQIHEFVIMPDHVHLLMSPGVETSLERAVQFIKGGFSYRAGKELGFKREIWQRGYVDHRIRDVRDYDHHREYIWSNPVRARLCELASAFAYSSANPDCSMDSEPQWLKPVEVSFRRHD